MEQIVERVVGGNGLLGGIFGETREAVLGGCWGLIMSAAFFFFFFVTAMIMIWGINTVPEQYQHIINGNAAIFIIMLCLSGFASPVIGILFGLQSGFYSVGRHVIAFALYLFLLMAAIVGISQFGFFI